MVETALRILVVDDHPDTRHWLAQELTHAGLLVHCAASGEQALKELAGFVPDAVLLDVVMGGLDGFATCERIREIDEELPVLFMTGLNDTEHVLRGFSAGANDYVTKPLSIPEIVARVQVHTRTARLVRSTREAVDASDLAMVALGTGEMLWCNDAARRLFDRLGLRSTDGTAPDPDSQARVLAAVAPLRDAQQSQTEVIFCLGGIRLRATTVAEPTEAHCLVSLAEAQEVNPAPVRLTARESEVLLWVARGKTNRDIADILGMSPRTVNKHLEHIFEKLGVETRTAAAAAARRLRIDEGDSPSP